MLRDGWGLRDHSGRIAVDQLVAGTLPSADATKVERTIAALRLKLMHADSTREVKRLRDEMFMLEQSRWAVPGVSILKRKSSTPVDIADVQEHLAPGTTLLEYVVAAPSSYCVVLTRTSAKLVPLRGRDELEHLTSSFLGKVKARQPALQEGRRLYDLLITPIGIPQVSTLVIVRDGPLHLLPFEALVKPNGRYLAETSTVTYAPSATSFYLLSREMQRQRSRSMLGVGGVKYTGGSINTAGFARSNQRSRFAELPSSGEEIRAAASGLGTPRTTILSGNRATETAFKRAELGSFQFIHLAVHGFADPKNPDRAALVMLSDPQNGEDGFLNAHEIVQLGLSAELVVLSACETAVGPLQGQEGIANLSRAFLFAGSRSVVSTLWEADDASSALLMKSFYAHIGDGQTPDFALAAAKRDILKKYGTHALPYLWAGFIIEGGIASPQTKTRRITNHVTDARASESNRF